MLKKFIRDFIYCGISGWCLEILFTSLCSLRRHNRKLEGNTSLWMFPIYGSAVFLKPFFFLFRKCSTLFRSFCYALLIFTGEYGYGTLLKRYDLCPWDYQNCRYQINALIRLDFLPVWAATGLYFEALLSSHGRRKDRIS